MADQANVLDKSMRSVFVGNIPYEATEEKLKDIFSEAGPVISFKLVYDRETGKPKGYGFCEYKDQETALSAMRNLNGYEIGGRNLRVDNACTEKSRLEIQSLLQGPISESQYGEPVSADKAPETVSKAVASLPPEQMFELMKQMMQCAQNNPAEARAMLLQNPQLAYALLQALVVMRVVDAQAAAGMLHQSSAVSLQNNTGPAPMLPPAPARVPAPVPPPPAGFSQDSDLRIMDPRLAAQAQRNAMDQDLRMPPSGFNDNLMPGMDAALDSFRQMPPRMPETPHYPGLHPGGPMPVSVPPMPVAPPVPQAVAPPPRAVPPPLPPNPPTTTTTASTAPTIPATSGQSQSDKEKAALIMQVLQLTDEQISMLPPEQRQSILVLKEQIAKAKRT
uniref:Cleavage stimulation factor subunit 2 n=1 Tax=Cacopsylla melanoneura TaxID=428564 RepID=A0A8D8VVG9_9HEMI